MEQEVTELQRKGAVIEMLLEGGFYSTLFLVPKKDGGQRPCNKSEVSEQPRVHSSLQNGGDSHTKNPITARRLACKGRPEGCLILHPNTTRP